MSVKKNIRCVITLLLVFILSFLMCEGFVFSVSGEEETAAQEITGDSELVLEFDNASDLDYFEQSGDGVWEISDGMLRQRNTNVGWFANLGLKDRLYKNFTMRYRVRIDGFTSGYQGWQGFSFRREHINSTQQQSGYLFNSGNNINGFELYDTATPLSVNYVEGAAGVRQYGFWNEFVIEVKDWRINVYFNDDIARQAEDPSGEHYSIWVEEDPSTFEDRMFQWARDAAGYLGFAAGSTRLSIDYFEIYTGDMQAKAFERGVDLSDTGSAPQDEVDPVGIVSGNQNSVSNALNELAAAVTGNTDKNMLPIVVGIVIGILALAGTAVMILFVKKGERK